MWETLKYLGNDLDTWAIAKICGKQLKYVGNDLDMREMA